MSATLRNALHQISLCSQNSMSDKAECGRIARSALAATTKGPPTMNTDALPYCPSNMENDEYFRLHGTLPTERILQLLDAETDTIASAGRIAEHVQAAHDGLPCEDFAEDILWKLTSLHEDETAISEPAAASLLAIIKELETLQADLYTRAEAAAQSLRCIKDELSAWVAL